MQFHQLLLLNIILSFISGKKYVIYLFIGHEEVLLMFSTIYRGHMHCHKNMTFCKYYFRYYFFDFLFANLKINMLELVF